MLLWACTLPAPLSRRWRPRWRWPAFPRADVGLLWIYVATGPCVQQLPRQGELVVQQAAVVVEEVEVDVAQDERLEAVLLPHPLCCHGSWCARTRPATWCFQCPRNTSSHFELVATFALSATSRCSRSGTKGQAKNTTFVRSASTTFLEIYIQIRQSCDAFSAATRPVRWQGVRVAIEVPHPRAHREAQAQVARVMQRLVVIRSRHRRLLRVKFTS
mmetsp:Transcript_33372/g.74370  ORF Transcript_33372/g.74370 Transcript_33372/m.74370 type:complete len:216 (+) Transcript_33372:1887-2534(+)